MIELLKYLLLGIVQGIAEILPISSSGHLALLQSVLNVNPDSEAVFAIFLHFASLVALVIFFWKTLWVIVKGFFRYIFKKDVASKTDFWLGVYIIVASIPAALVGVLLEDVISDLFSQLLYVGIGFLITATILLLWPLFGKNVDSEIGWKHVLFAGLFQAIGIVPGISRSGITITGAKVAGLKEEPAKKFAFLLFVPIALGSFILGLGDVGAIFTSAPDAVINYGLAMVAAFIFTYSALLFIFYKFKYSHAKYYGAYLIIVGIFTIVYSLLII